VTQKKGSVTGAGRLRGLAQLTVNIGNAKKYHRTASNDFFVFDNDDKCITADSS